MRAKASRVGYDGTASHSFWSSYTAAGGSRSGPHAALLPALHGMLRVTSLSSPLAQTHSAFPRMGAGAGQPLP
eukprot:scaffold105141_cov35-Tisochrysis_lutea.AAC.3